MRHFFLTAWIFGVLIVAPAAAHAHAANTSYLKASSASLESPVTLTWDVSAADLDWALDLDLDADGAVTWGELEAHRDTITTLAIKSLDVERGGQPCVVSGQDFALTQHIDALFISLGLSAQCPKAGALSLASSLFFSQDASQRVLVQAHVGRAVFNSVLSPGAPRWSQPAIPSTFESVLRFVQQGIVHVWSGWDHIAFVLLLILPSVLRKYGRRDTLKDLLSVITTFTIAHSVTLSLAATHSVELPERLVENAILASIIVAAIMNFLPTATRWRLVVAFAFGLMHGFGFARSLLEIDATGAHLLPMLAGFNVGVEIAQLIIVIAALPLLLRLRAPTVLRIQEQLLRDPVLARSPYRRGSSCSSGS